MIGLSLFVLAQVEAERFTCANPIDQSTMIRCAYEDYRAADRELNEQWKKTIAYQRMLDHANFTDKDGWPTWTDALTRSQRAWITFRDAQCEREGLEMRGSGGPQLRGECLARMTRDRTIYLKSLDEN